jgi:hypothetical protein
LFLCYNVALAEQLLALVKKRKLQKGEVIVGRWESLARELLDAAGVGWDNPVLPTERDFYCGEVVPSLMRDIVRDQRFAPRFDALVVDEAQDHDTCWPGSQTENGHSGWWEIYWKLLREGTDAERIQFRAISNSNPKTLENVHTYCALFQGTYDFAAERWTVTDARPISAQMFDILSEAYADSGGNETAPFGSDQTSDCGSIRE